MIRHMAVFRWTPEATPEQRERVCVELSRLPALIPSLRAYHFGSDLGVNEGNFDFGVVADFDDVEAYLAYRANAEHQDIISRFSGPHAVSRAAVQYEI